MNGVTVRDTKNDPNSATAIVIVSGMNINFATPLKNTMGRKTITVVSVETKIGEATSLAAATLPGFLTAPLFVRCSGAK